MSVSKSNERLIQWTFALCGAVSIFVTLGIFAVLFWETFHFFQEVPLGAFLFGTKWTPLFVQKQFGILPLISGTLLIALIAMIIALPLGISIAIFLREYASSHLRRTLKPILEILAGIPTIVYGYFALLTVTPFLQKVIPELAGFNALSPGIVMGIMILPLSVSLSDDAIHAVPEHLRMGAYALGAKRLEVVFRVVLPAAMSGIVSAGILSISRAIGETMLVTIAAGMRPLLTLNPLGPVQTITAYIVQVSLGDTPTGTLEYSSIFAVATVLFLCTFFLNTIAQRLRQSFQHMYA
ncbi:phosphate ABC transporter permease subunit PstC [Candidatus Peregrinibacteria bacterium CG10_big_fil_rev_8_21_14_0_10_49_16]|nr:MAG: phosphate ABC transporter permease subunit PstC [Candidatus Peregrinibacteria bacterium CG10_big_fil_rev_8_21_14_0_10_49_16]